MHIVNGKGMNFAHPLTLAALKMLQKQSIYRR